MFTLGKAPGEDLLSAAVNQIPVFNNIIVAAYVGAPMIKFLLKIIQRWYKYSKF